VNDRSTRSQFKLPLDHRSFEIMTATRSYLPAQIKSRRLHRQGANTMMKLQGGYIPASLILINGHIGPLYG